VNQQHDDDSAELRCWPTTFPKDRVAELYHPPFPAGSATRSRSQTGVLTGDTGHNLVEQHPPTGRVYAVRPPRNHRLVWGPFTMSTRSGRAARVGIVKGPLKGRTRTRVGMLDNPRVPGRYSSPPVVGLWGGDCGSS
jgi:hypothetical protein